MSKSLRPPVASFTSAKRRRFTGEEGGRETPAVRRVTSDELPHR